jgi:quercetin dioxygenase-like cupin family protein
MATIDTGYSSDHHREGEPRHLDALLLRLDLPRELAELRQGEVWRRGELRGKTLAKHPNLRVVLMTLETGLHVGEHEVPVSISLQVLEGRVRLKLSPEAVELPSGSLFLLGPNLRHDLEALEPSAVLLTVAWPPKGHETAEDARAMRRAIARWENEGGHR